MFSFGIPLSKSVFSGGRHKNGQIISVGWEHRIRAGGQEPIEQKYNELQRMHMIVIHHLQLSGPNAVCLACRMRSASISTCFLHPVCLMGRLDRLLANAQEPAEGDCEGACLLSRRVWIPNSCHERKWPLP